MIDLITEKSTQENLTAIQTQFDLQEQELAVLFQTTINELSPILKGDTPAFENQRKERLFSTEVMALSLLESVPADERLRGYIQELQARYHIDVPLLAKLCKISPDTLSGFLQNTQTFSAEFKYLLCIRTVYLLFLFRARDTQ